MAVDLLLGLQWGDEGKGKIVDVLTGNYDIIARFQGGPNAGHTLIFDGHKHVLHTIPSGIFHKTALNVVGNGVVIDPVIFKKELENLDKHEVDYTSKGKAKIGSTLKGIGPTYMDKTGRNGMRVGDLELENWKDKYHALTAKHLGMLDYFNIKIEYDLEELEAEFDKGIEKLRTLQFIDSEEFLNQAIKSNKTILAEGAQGSLLDIDFGTYPFVTSSNTTAAGACTGLGVAPNRIKDVYGIFKAYTTRVGSGPFPTELFDKDGEEMARIGQEFGATTGRPRRCGWLDLVALKYAVDVNGVTQLMMMKGDVLSGFDTLKICTSYNYKGKEISHFPYNIEPENVSVNYSEFKGWDEDLTKMTSAEQLPKNLMDYVAFIEKETGVPVKIVSVGPDRKQTIVR
jgi:adenylosuccinate synthase